MNLGHGQRRSVMILWAWTALLSAFVLYPVLAEQNPTYLPFGMVAILVVLFTVLHPSVRRPAGPTATATAAATAPHATAPPPGGDTATQDPQLSAARTALPPTLASAP